LTPLSAGSVTAAIAADVAVDGDNNSNLAAVQFARTWGVSHWLYLPAVWR
jgi:hypothetical protein